ncbi:MAG: hypothetical protein ACYS22_04260 [Planctomycetota bacterium]|jgi:hypothetical protein
MRIDQAHLPWIKGSIIGLVLSTIAYVIYAMATPGGPKGDTWIGLGFGVAGTAMIVFAGVLGGRRKMITLRVGPLSAWLKGHLYLGALSLPMILFHGAFAFGGTLTTVLMWLLIVTVFSGIVGAILQHTIPSIMTREAGVSEATHGQLEQRLQNLRWDALQLMQQVVGKAEPELVKRAKAFAETDSEPSPWRSPDVLDWEAQHLRKEIKAVAEGRPALDHDPTTEEKAHLMQFYRNAVAPYLDDPHNASGEARAMRRELDAALVFDIQRAQHEELDPVFHRLQEICGAVRDLLRQRWLHAWLHGWQVVHIPISVGLMVLMIAHIFMALRY